jgi:hypothetical protein
MEAFANSHVLSLLRRPVVLAYLALVAGFLWIFCQFYLPGKGFTYLINFGSKNEQSSLTKLRRVDHYVDRYSDGYDAQYYAQIALDPSLRNTQLLRAVDDLPYRARRILLSATAYVMGLGQPAWILQAFSLQNGICWLLLAWISMRWFPPTNWINFIRWSGILLSLGMCASVRNALLDGPSLLFISVGVLLIELNRPWLATAVLGLSGLGKETNLLGAASLLPTRDAGWKEWGWATVRGALTSVPLMLWVFYLYLHFGPVSPVGLRNFALPFTGYGHKWHETLASFPALSGRNLHPLANLSMLIAITVQFLYLVLRPQWRQAWWRVGVSFALLTIFLGDAVWEGEPGAASRVLLPMQFAFNVLVPSRRWWLPILLLGNLTLLTGHIMLDPLANEGYEIKGNRSLLSGPTGRSMAMDFSEGWYADEHDRDNYWTWSSGNCVLMVHNPHAQSLRVRLRFVLSPNGARSVMVRLNGTEKWQTLLGGNDRLSASISDLVLVPGENRIDFMTDTPACTIGTDRRPLAFNLGNLRLDLLDLQP